MPQFAELGGFKGGSQFALPGGLTSVDGAGSDQQQQLLAQQHQMQMQKMHRQAQNDAHQQDVGEIEEEGKDLSHLLQVFKIYRNQDQLRNSGIFNGGLDIGIDPMQLSVDFNIKE